VVFRIRVGETRGGIGKVGPCGPICKSHDRGVWKMLTIPIPVGYLTSRCCSCLYRAFIMPESSLGYTDLAEAMI
jgi:hypothetical protein